MTSSTFGRGVDGESSIYIVNSPAQLESMDELSVVLKEIGYSVWKRPPRETTLRVYPFGFRTYPLLNPHFWSDAEEVDAMRKGPHLVVFAYTKRETNTWTELFSRFPSSPECTFIDEERQCRDKFFLHGFFLSPLPIIGGNAERLEFSALRKPLTGMLRFFERCATGISV